MGRLVTATTGTPRTRAASTTAKLDGSETSSMMASGLNFLSMLSASAVPSMVVMSASDNAVEMSCRSRRRPLRTATLRPRPSMLSSGSANSGEEGHEFFEDVGFDGGVVVSEIT